MTDQEKRIINAGAEAIRNTAPSCDQAYNEAEKIFRVFVAMQQETMAIMNEPAQQKAAADAQATGTGYTETAPDGTETHIPAGEVHDLAPPLEVEPPVPATQEELDHEAQEAARRAEQEEANEAQLADASPLDKPQTGKGSRKAKASPLDGQATTDPVSKLDK